MNKNNFLEGKNILITGASSGIGRTLTKNLSKFGANIIMLSKNEKKLDSIYDEIKEKYKTDPYILKLFGQFIIKPSLLVLNSFK